MKLWMWFFILIMFVWSMAQASVLFQLSGKVVSFDEKKVTLQIDGKLIIVKREALAKLALRPGKEVTFTADSKSFLEPVDSRPQSQK